MMNALSRRNKKAAKNSERYEVAGQWKLVWWKFKKHKMATIALPIIVIMYLLTMCCEFFAPSLPLDRFKKSKDCPPTLIRLWDREGKFRGPFVYQQEPGMDPVTFRRTFVDTDEIVPLGFFVRGFVRRGFFFVFDFFKRALIRNYR